MHTFFSRVQVHHAGRLPAAGPLLVVSNHHSSLVDPVALLATLPRQPRFLAKSVLWSLPYLLLRPLLWLAKAIPVYRHVDGGGDNSGMFEASHRALADGDVIALFAEGVSHNMAGLLDLRTGAARIALGSQAEVAIVPVGLIYDDRATFRSRAMIYVGHPIVVQGQAGGDSDRERVREVTAWISAGLDDVAPSWETWESYNAALLASRLAVAHEPDLEFAEVLTQLNRAVDDGTDQGAAVLHETQQLEVETARLGLDIEAVVDQPADRIGRLDRLTYLKTALFVLPTVIGRFLNLAPHALIGHLAKRQDLNFRATFKILSALVIYPLWWLLVAVVVSFVWHPLAGVVAFAVLPVLGYIAARTYGRLRRFRNRQAVREQRLRQESESLLQLRLRSVVAATQGVLAV